MAFKVQVKIGRNVRQIWSVHHKNSKEILDGNGNLNQRIKVKLKVVVNAYTIVKLTIPPIKVATDKNMTCIKHKVDYGNSGE